MSSKDESDLSRQVKFLQDVLQNASVKDETAADNLAVLLRQLDEAGDVAQGVEDKLDKLLENLEGMIEELEGNKVSVYILGLELAASNNPVIAFG